MPHILVEITESELTILQAIRDFMTLPNGLCGRSPQAHEIVPLESRFKNAADRNRIKMFRRLVTVGAIRYSPNGYCCLTDAGNSLLDRPGVIAE